MHEILRQTGVACERAARLASQSLTFAKGGALVRRTGHPEELLKDAVDLARAGSPVGIHLFLEDGLSPAEFDAGQMGQVLHQVLHNVLLNARQSMPEGGVIEVRAGNVTADASLPLPM